ncbi:daptide-type RiPP biosynthesis methyltransferase [Amycolatopsis sp. NPDC059021]|uniref:daptide-type RiPP biosynthesis methyltransferase n=1 Tax=Amycolatopsis sp. NPDC059021 TaxID=3346704 RepID=UPI0036733FD6
MTAAPGTAGQLAALYGLRPQPLYGPAGAVVYDAMCRRDLSELPEVLRLARESGGPILELACGSGRLALPLAARGHDVVALDNSAALLDILRSRDERIRVVEADMSGFAFDEGFALIVLAASSVCLLDRAERATVFGLVADHLTPDGVFYVSGMDFAPALTSRTRAAERIAVVPDGGTVLTLHQHFDGRRGVRTTSVFTETVDDHVTVGRELFTSEVHLLASGDLTTELALAGLEVVEQRHGTAGEQVPYRLVCRHA